MNETKHRVEVCICMGSSCFSRGNRRNVEAIRDYLVRNGLSEKVSLTGHLCEGMCKCGPNISLAGQTFHCIDSADSALVDSLLEKHLKVPE